MFRVGKVIGVEVDVWHGVFVVDGCSDSGMVYFYRNVVKVDGSLGMVWKIRE